MTIFNIYLLILLTINFLIKKFLKIIFNTIIFNKKKIKKYLKNIFLKIISILILISYSQINTIYCDVHIKKASKNFKTHLHYGKTVTISIYDITGNLILQVISTNIQYFPNQKTIQIIYPKIFIFNKKETLMWKISCNQATLDHEKQLNLTGYVYINYIINDIYIHSIITSQLTINLIKKNIISNNKTIIHGPFFYSIGSKMYAELKKNKINLIDTIYTQYEIKRT